MSTITTIDLATPNDGNGDPLRTGGVAINANFQNLNTDKLERGGYAGSAQDLKNDIDAIDAAGVTAAGNNTFTGLNTFTNNIELQAGLTMSVGALNITDVLAFQVDDVNGWAGIDDLFTVDGQQLRFVKGVLVERT